MKILVINTGSSSIKYELFQMPNQSNIASGLLERIGEKKSRLSHNTGDLEKPMVIEKPVKDHEVGMKEIVELLTDKTIGVIKHPSEISAIGHRIVHGGEAFKAPTVIDEEVIEAIKEHIPLAPLHNPANLIGIETASSLFQDVMNVGVFDTAFHQSLLPHSFHYAIPNSYYQKLKIRRYGFHGISHGYVTKKTAAYLGKPVDSVNLITAHLGNGASMCAIKNGKSVDTSMGMTPLEGLIMGTRSGDIDPAIHFYLADHSELEFHEIDELLNKESGLKGLVGINDMRDIIKRKHDGDENAILAIDMYTYRIKKYIGSYFAVLGGVDAIVFTAGIGENSADVRELSLKGMEEMGISIDKDKNNSSKDGIFEIQDSKSRIKVLVVPTDEELEIALQTYDIIA
ncbi:acetate/propionate family kinase [Spirochaetota bacterium]